MSNSSIEYRDMKELTEDKEHSNNAEGFNRDHDDREQEREILEPMLILIYHVIIFTGILETIWNSSIATVPKGNSRHLCQRWNIAQTQDFFSQFRNETWSKDHESAIKTLAL